MPIIVITAQPKAAASATDVFARFEKPLPTRLVLDAVERAVHRNPPGGASGRPHQRAA